MNRSKFDQIIEVIRQRYTAQDTIPLHAPVFEGNEKKYVLNTIDSTFVSSVGEYVNRFEQMIAEIAGTSYAVATVNGTTALHMALLVSGVLKGDEVLTQALTFVATANSIKYLDANPVFLDVDKETLGLSSEALNDFLEEYGELKEDGSCWNKKSGRKISACVPMHTFGHPCKIDEIIAICNKWGITVIEDAAESLGSYYMNRHTGSFGRMGIFSLNGNKIVTSGGGGAIVTDEKAVAEKAKHLTTQAKKGSPWKYEHDFIGYNYRLPNINAALAYAQLERLDAFLKDKRSTAEYYKEEFGRLGIPFHQEPNGAQSNYWLNTIYLKDSGEKEAFLKYSNEKGVMTRPVWKLINKLNMYNSCQSTSLENAEWLEDHVVNIPSSYRS